jgi:16S rRNA (uracil1498-N3)-methyltransferase
MSSRTKSRTRLFVDHELDRASLELSDEQAHYLSRVLRCRPGDSIVVFNARGVEREATIESLAKRHPALALGPEVEALPESPAAIVLLQALVKSDAMDLIVQKATELGVAAVLAFPTEFSVVHLAGERGGQRLAHWRRIAASACEQSGRHRPPELELFSSLDAAVAALAAGSAAKPGSASPPPAALPPAALAPGAPRIVFDPSATRALDSSLAGNRGFALALGPEGGFNRDELRYLESSGFTPATLGPRVLRAETAVIAAAALVQWLAGDLSPPVPGSR